MPRLTIALLLTFALLTAGCAGAPKPDVPRHLTLLYFGDLEGVIDAHADAATGQNVGGVPQLAALIDKIRKQNEAHNVPTLLLYTGGVRNDSPLSKKFRGAAVVRLLLEMNVDALAIDLTDFIDGRREIDRLSKRKPVPFVTANLRDNAKTAPWLPLGFGKQFDNGMTVALAGVAAPGPGKPGTLAADLIADDPIKAAQLAVGRTAGIGSIKLLLSRCDLATNQQLANQVDGLHAVIGGTGMPLDQPLVENGVYLTNVKGRAEALGRLDFERRGDTVTVLRHKTYAVTPDLPENRIVRSLVDGFINRLAEGR